jgi:hypothetical protein
MPSTIGLYSGTSAPEVAGTDTTSLYGGSGVPVPGANGNTVVRGDLTVTGNATVQGELTVGDDVCIEGDTITLRCNATTIGNSQIIAYRGGGANTSATITWDETASVPPGSEPSGRWVTNCGLTAPGLIAGQVNIAPNLNDNLITTTTGTSADLVLDADSNQIVFVAQDLSLAQGTILAYSEANDRLNRPTIQSTTGNTSGLRIQAPNATSSAVAVSSVFNTNDADNGKFINIRADGSATPISIRTGEFVAGVLGASNASIQVIDGVTTYATINPAGVINNTDLATKLYVDNNDTNTTYTIDASSTTGGANFNLVGSDATTDTIKFAGSGGTTVTRTSANEITVSSTAGVTYNIDASSATGGANLNLTGSDSSTDTVKFANGSNVTITRTNANEITIAATDTNTTYTQDASAATGGANLNLVGSDATTDTIKFAGGTNVTVTATTANEITIAATDTNTTYTIDASSTTGGANFNLVGSDATTDTIKFAGSGATTVTQTSANEITISSTDSNTTYTIDASSTTGGANLNLVGSDSTTDTVKFASGTGVTVSQTNANEMSIAIGQAVGTGDSPAFAGVTGGNIAVGTTDDNTIASTNTNGNITIDPNGTGVVIFDSITRLRGESQATTNNSYVFPVSQLTTISDNNGYSAASSFGTTGSGFQANAQYIHYTGDTAAGANAVPSLNFRQAQGNSVTGVNLPWLGTNSVAASASQSGDVLGTTNYNGYATTGFTNDIATQYQGGGLGTSHIIQFQATAAEAFADGTKTLSSSDITAVASSFRSALGSPQVTGTKGQISFTATTPAVGQAIRVTGTLTGTATGIVTGNNYWIIATASTTTATLSATPNGPPIDTTAGTLTGLTLTRCGVTFTIANQTSYPFGRNALVTIANVTNLTDGTYPVSGGVTSLTSISLGVPHTVAPTLPGTQQFTCPTVTNAGGGYRIRGIPLATPLNPANRLELVNHTAAAATFRADTFTFAGGAYAGTGTTRLTVEATKITAAVPVQFPSYTAVAANAITGALGQQIAISNSPTVGGRMAFWDTTNARWSYISDNTAV